MWSHIGCIIHDVLLSVLVIFWAHEEGLKGMQHGQATLMGGLICHAQNALMWVGIMRIGEH